MSPTRTSAAGLGEGLGLGLGRFEGWVDEEEEEEGEEGVVEVEGEDEVDFRPSTLLRLSLPLAAVNRFADFPIIDRARSCMTSE